MNSRLICLIPHYNNLQGLLRSLASIAPEDECDVIVVDDGSAFPPSLAELQSALSNGGDVDLYCLGTNCGIEHALNQGIQWARKKGCEYIARLDCGDVCNGTRFNVQRQYLDSNPEIAIVGSWVRFVSETGELLYELKLPCVSNDILASMRWNNALIHPSVCFRAQCADVIGDYPTEFPAAEDYAFFWMLAKRFGAANIPEFLVDCECNDCGISAQKRRRQLLSRAQIQWKLGGARNVLGVARTLLVALIPKFLVQVLKK